MNNICDNEVLEPVGRVRPVSEKKASCRSHPLGSKFDYGFVYGAGSGKGIEVTRRQSSKSR